MNDDTIDQIIISVEVWRAAYDQISATIFNDVRQRVSPVTSFIDSIHQIVIDEYYLRGFDE